MLGSATMFAVVAETLTVGDRPMRLERVGRPEIKNGTLRVKEFDTVNPDLEIRDLYNDEDAFDLRAEHLGAYRARFNANLAFLRQSRRHGRLAAAADGSHPLTELLLHDFLVVDVSKPFMDGTSLEIERAMLAGRTAGDLWWAVAQRQLHGQLLHDADQRRKRCAHQRRPDSGDRASLP